MSSIENLKPIIRSLVLSCPQTLTIQRLLTDFRTEEGYVLPYAKLGFSSAEEFLRKAMRDVVTVHGVGNFAMLFPIVNKKSEHVMKLVCEQNHSRARRPRRRSQVNLRPRQANNSYSQHNARHSDMRSWRKTANSSSTSSPDNRLSATRQSAQRDVKHNTVSTSLQHEVRSNTSNVSEVTQLASQLKKLNLSEETKSNSSNLHNRILTHQYPERNMSHCNNNNYYQSQSNSSSNETNLPDKTNQYAKYSASKEEPNEIEYKGEEFTLNAQEQNKPMLQETESNMALKDEESTFSGFNTHDAESILTNKDFAKAEYSTSESSELYDSAQYINSCTDASKSESDTSLCCLDISDQVGKMANVFIADQTDIYREVDSHSPIFFNSKPGVLTGSAFDSDEAVPEYACSASVHMVSFPKDSAKMGTKIQPPELPYGVTVDSIIKIYVTQVHDAYRFWYHVYDINFELDYLMSRIDYFYKNQSEDLEFIRECIQPGQLCATIYDGKYHRAEILSSINQNDRVKVFFMDYGTVSQVDVKDIKYLHNDFVTLPAFAHRGSLGEINPIRLHWCVESSLAFLSLASNRLLYARICEINAENRVCYMNICSSDAEQQTIQINRTLIEMGLALKSYAWNTKKEGNEKRLRHKREDYPTFDMLESGEYPTLSENIDMEKKGISYETITDKLIYYPRILNENTKAPEPLRKLPFLLLDNNPFASDIVSECGVELDELE